MAAHLGHGRQHIKTLVVHYVRQAVHEQLNCALDPDRFRFRNPRPLLNFVYCSTYMATVTREGQPPTLPMMA